MLIYKFDVLDALKNKGWSTYRIKKEHIMSEGTVQKLRGGMMVGPEVLNLICKILEKQPGSIIKYVDDAGEEKE